MQYTVRKIPKWLDKAIRDRAKTLGKSINDVIIDLLYDGFRANGQLVKRRDLSKFAGTWVEDPAFDEAMKGFEQINPETWGMTNDPNYARHEPVQRSSTRRSGRRRSA
jgi:hypothetical protein